MKYLILNTHHSLTTSPPMARPASKATKKQVLLGAIDVHRTNCRIGGTYGNVRTGRESDGWAK